MMTFCFKGHCHFEAADLAAALRQLSAHFTALASADIDAASAALIPMTPESEMSLLQVDPVSITEEVMH